MINKKQLSPKVLIYIGECGLTYINDNGDTLRIGATTSFTDLLHSSRIKEKVPLLAEAVSHIGSPAIRNMGTVGGNLAIGSPASDSATALLALGASLNLISKTETRIVGCDDFFIAPGQTVLRPDELIQEIIIPKTTIGAKWGYRKLGRRKGQSISVVSAAICCHAVGTKCNGARIALGAVAPTPVLASEASSLLEGESVEKDLIDKVAKKAAHEIDPIDDVRSSAWYRRRVSEVLVKRLLLQIFS